MAEAVSCRERAHGEALKELADSLAKERRMRKSGDEKGTENDGASKTREELREDEKRKLRQELKERRRKERRTVSRRVREAGRRGPLDTTEARESRKKRVKKRKRGQKKEDEIKSRAKWRLPFYDAYRQAQKARHSYNQQVDPLNI